MSERFNRARVGACAFALTLITSIAAWGGAAIAGEGPAVLTPEAALRLAIEHSPALEAAVIEARRAAESVALESDRYHPTLSASLDYTHTERPSLNINGLAQSTGDSVRGSVGVAQQFPWGTSLAASLGLGGSQSQTVTPGLEQRIPLGPGYSVDVDVSINQPLLRGSGRTLWEAALWQARVTREAARTAEEQAASAVARDVLVAYWELWYAQEAVTIQEQALATARRRLSDAEAQVAAGARARFDVLPLRTEVARIDEALVTARATLANRRVALARQVGRPLFNGLSAAPAAPGDIGAVPDAERVTAVALERAYELADLRAGVEQARIGARVAAEQARVRLDAGAWLRLSGLGNADAAEPFEQVATFSAVSGGVSLTLELPTSRAVVEGEAARARMQVDGAQARLRAAEEQLAQQAAELVEATASSRARVEFALETVRLAGESVSGQQDRFASGVGTTLELVVAEQDLREAELRVARARVDLEATRLQLAHLTGELLAEVATN